MITSKMLVMVLSFLSSIVLFILGTMFVQWGGFNPNEWEAFSRAAWLFECIMLSVIFTIGISMTEWYKDL